MPALHRILKFPAALSLLFLAGGSAAQSPENWTHDGEMLKFFQAATRIRELHPSEPSMREISEQALAGYLASLDPYSRYLDAATYAGFRESQQANYAGIGLELSAAPDGRIFFIPYPESPAAEAGLQEGQQLLRVDGIEVRGRPIHELPALIRGKPDTTVEIELLDLDGKTKTVALRRRSFTAPSVVLSDYRGVPWMRVFTFTPDTAAEMRRALNRMGADHQLLLDLRGTPGGSMFGAIDAARLFLRADETVTTLRTGGETKTYHARGPAAFPGLQLFLLQDERTASAAELFAAALVGNRRALSVGRRTHGKGKTQQIVELIDGSAMLLTDGEIFSPEGHPIEGVGVEPHLPLMGDQPDLAAHLLAIELVLNAAREPSDDAAE